MAHHQRTLSNYEYDMPRWWQPLGPGLDRSRRLSDLGERVPEGVEGMSMFMLRFTQVSNQVDAAVRADHLPTRATTHTNLQSKDDIITEVLQAGEDANIWADDLAPAREVCCLCKEAVLVSQTLRLPCELEKHWACYECIPMFFEQALVCEHSYPPRCCLDANPLQIEDFEHVLAKSHPALPQKYREKADEYQTFLPFRRYCANDFCRKFLSTDHYIHRTWENKVVPTRAMCTDCNSITCIACASLLPGSWQPHTCQPIPASLDIDYDMDGNRQKFCPYCGIPVGIEDGCNHMTCHCANQWCFQCLAPWEGFHECEQYNDPSTGYYDMQGYGQDGHHRIYQLDRQGYDRKGVNIEGKNRLGAHVPGFRFAKREPNQAHRPQGFQDLQDEELCDAATVLLIQDVEAGVNHGSNDVSELFESRLGIQRPEPEEEIEYEEEEEQEEEEVVYDTEDDDDVVDSEDETSIIRRGRRAVLASEDEGSLNNEQSETRLEDGLEDHQNAVLGQHVQIVMQNLPRGRDETWAVYRLRLIDRVVGQEPEFGMQNLRAELDLLAAQNRLRNV